ncbi:MAG: hypothetical protein HY893_02195 [Deltaproteobacteria bacterium]|nr:hypothetical protein [Deltaproteobacteria bacterium]
MTVFMAISAITAFLLSGYVLLRIIDLKGELGLNTGVRAAISFSLGLGAISLQMFLYSLASIPFGFYSVSAPWVIIAGALLLYSIRKRPQKAASSIEKTGPGLFDVILSVVILSQAAYALVYALALPLAGWDAWFIWFLKGRAFFVDRTVSNGFLTNGLYAYDHPEYPLLIPLSIAWVYTAIGHVSETAAKAIFPLQFYSMLAVFYYFTKRLWGRRAGLVFTALLSLTPIVLIHSGGFPVKIGVLYVGDFVGHADLTIAVYFLSACAFFYLYTQEGRTPQVILSGLFLALGAWTKNEGLAFAALGFLGILIYLMTEKKGWWLKAAIIAAVLMLFIAPWSVYKTGLGLKSEYTGNMGLSVFFGNIGRIKLVLTRMVEYMFGYIALYNFTWWLYAASFIFNLRGLARKPLLILNAMLLSQLAVYVLIYVISPNDINWLIQTSLDRVLLHLTPLSMLIAAVNLKEVLGENGRQ